MLAVVAHHVTLWLDNNLSAQLIESSLVMEWLHLQSISLKPLRMPLFTILSGFIYAHRPVTLGTSKTFVSGKIRRILIPLFFASTVTYLKDVYIAGNVPAYKFLGVMHEVELHEFWKLWFFHYKHLWFLHALIVIFAMAMVLDILGWMRSLRSWIFWLVVLTVLPYIYGGNSFWSNNQTIVLAVYFFVGVGFYRFRNSLTKAQWLLPLSWIIFLGLMVLNFLSEFEYLELKDTRILYVLAGACGSYCLLNLHLAFRWLAWIGSFSYTIYLYHGLGMESHLLFDDVLHWGKAGRALWFLLTLTCGLAIPIMIHKLFINIPLLRTPVLGKRAFDTVPHPHQKPASKPANS